MIIDDKIKRGFDLEMVDLNNDGKKEFWPQTISITTGRQFLLMSPLQIH